MKEKTDIKDRAREKYLSRKPLDPEEEVIIQNDLDSPEFADFSRDTGLPLLLPEKYSAESTFSIIEKRIGKIIHKRMVWKYGQVAASIALLLGFSWIVWFLQSPVNQLTASTGYGETKEIVLPDHSVVVLNALSTLSYPERFSKEERLINLKGEGYFKVQKDSGKPFKVQTDGMAVEVLGTVFNIQSYDNEEIIKTSLLEGSVAVQSGANRQILKPGETAYYNKASSLFEIRRENLSSITQWQQGILVFDNTPLSGIFKTLERQYPVQFNWRNTDLQQLRITAQFTTDESIGEIVAILSSSAGFSYVKQGNKYSIRSR
jgi:ferric-dicitrate binding protein FerR (iron transport regulator)